MGTGTSTGVPMIGCSCTVCGSRDPRNRRYRASAWVEIESGNKKVSLLIDTPPEMRLAAIENGVSRIDAVLYTHAHADHIFGLDDIRRFNIINNGEIPCYARHDTAHFLRRTFSYIFDVSPPEGGWKPSIRLVEVDRPFFVDGINVQPVPVLHGSMTVYGYRIGGFAYVTDVSEIPSESMARLKGLHTLVLGALRPNPHPTHFHIDRAIEVAGLLKSRRTVFTHMTHDVDYETTNRNLPSGIELGYDGMVLLIP